MDDTQLLEIVRSQINDSVSYLGSELSEDRAVLLNQYYGRPYGNEVEGRSQVVSRDIQDTIEWILPSLLRIFATDEYCKFEPVGPDDEPRAEQETDYVNHVISQDNNGFLLFYDWFKEALLLRSGVVTWGWDVEEKREIELYTGLSTEELEMLVATDNVEVLEHTEYPAPELDPPPEAVEKMLAQGQQPPPPATLHDVRIAYVQEQGKCVIYSLPSEEFLIDRRARSIEDAIMCGHRRRMSRAELLDEGWGEERVDEIMRFDDEEHHEYEAIARDHRVFDSERGHDDPHESMRRTWVYTLYMRVDYDDDGYPELRRLTYAGDEILENEEAHEMPYADLCPVRMPHRFYGQSVGDLVADIQRIKTDLWRQSLDNIHLVNNPMKEVGPGVNVNDLLVSRVGGLVRVRTMGTVREITTTPMTAHSLQLIEYADSVREGRTGVSKFQQGLDGDTLNQGRVGVVTQMMSQAQMRVELIARLFAETGVKALIRGVHRTLMRNQDKARMVRLRGDWVPVDPATWRARDNVQVTVGLGNGNRMEQMATLQQIQQMQLQYMQMGLPIVQAQNVHHLAVKTVEAGGFRNAEQFFTDPATLPPPPPPGPTPEEIQMQLVQAQMQAEMQKAQMQAQTKLTELESKEGIEGAKLAVEREKIAADLKADLLKIAASDGIDSTEADIIRKEIEVAVNHADQQNESAKVDAMLQGMQAIMERLSAPRVATLPDGTQATIQSA